MDLPSDREHRCAGQIGLRACAAIADCEVPTIARVQGWCSAHSLLWTYGWHSQGRQDPAKA